MQNFVKPFVVPFMKGRRSGRICEIGSCLGEGTQRLRAIPGSKITVIDPCLDADLQQKFADDAQVELRKGLSLDELPKLDGSFDCILVDGDHNWYTVYNELNLISERDLVRKGGVVFLHDVDAPWGRRDMYYQPDTIPAEYQQEWEPVQSLAFKRAKHEGGQRNGVLTAIEDFLQKHRAEYRFFHVKAGHGLGMIQRRGTFSDNLAFLFLECKGFLFNAAIKLMKLAKMEFHRNKTKRMGLGYRA